MSNLLKLLMASITVASIAAPTNVIAAEPRSVSCSVAVDYLLNGVVRAPYQKDFVVNPGVPFEDDFSTVTRFRIFDASTHLEAGRTVVAISYYNDVGVFDAIDFSTSLTLREDRDDETVSGSHRFFTSRPTSADHTTNYSLACRRLKQ